VVGARMWVRVPPFGLSTSASTGEGRRTRVNMGVRGGSRRSGRCGAPTDDSPRRQPWDGIHERGRAPDGAKEDVRFAVGERMDSVAPSGARCFQHRVPRLTPWAIVCRPSGPQGNEGTLGRDSGRGGSPAEAQGRRAIVVWERGWGRTRTRGDECIGTIRIPMPTVRGGGNRVRVRVRGRRSPRRPGKVRSTDR